MLITKRRFLPLFCTQFLGAFNDNLFKNAVALFIAFRAASEAESGLLINLAAGLFILPFALFSPLAGALSDKFDKSRVLKISKSTEILAMLIGGLGLYYQQTTLLMITIFLMGTQSTFFGPAKYGILPEHLEEEELTSGNSLISMSTFIAIIFGLMASSVLVKDEYIALLPLTVIAIAGIGFFSATQIPPSKMRDPRVKINWNFISDIVAINRISKSTKSIHNSILAISWLWAIGSVIMTQLPNVAKFVLNSNEDMAIGLTISFVIGISIGSALTIWFSRKEIELGLVPLGAFGITIFGVDLSLLTFPDVGAQETIRSFFLSGFVANHWRLAFDLAMVGMFCSLYVIPLYALIQARAEETQRSRVIASNNILNSLFMVTAALLSMALYAAGARAMEILLCFFVLNAVVAAYIFTVIPEFVMRFVLWLLASTIYKISYTGRTEIPRHGALVIIANHVSFIDWFVITAACRRPVHFVIDHRIFKIPVLSWIFKTGKAIAIASAKESPETKEQAFEKISDELQAGHVVCIFPEGMITHDGNFNTFRPGVEKILERDPCPVVPIGLNGLWGSYFSRYKGKAMVGLPRLHRRKIQVNIGKPLDPKMPATEMQKVVAELCE